MSELEIHDRPREKLVSRGAENVKDYELVAILLRTGIKGMHVLELSKHVLEQYPLDKLLVVSFKDLKQIKGIDTTKACTLLASIELTKRILNVREDTVALIEKPADIIPHVQHIRTQKKEHFVVLYLNARNQVLHTETISVGTINASIVHPREVFEPAIKHVASCVVLVHNHPSGEVEPSDADLLVTKRLVESGKLLGIEVMDHIIISSGKMYSFREHGRI